MLREVQRLDGPAFTSLEAAEVWELSADEAERLLRELNRVGLIQAKSGNTDRIWWMTELALYDLDCRV